jgi:PAS domain S-box-containing protein
MNAPATILVVDDVAANRDTLRELLEPEGYRLLEAADGPAALQLAAATPPDLVLLDVMMPGMDGFEVCRRLRAHPQLAEVPVIMVTALDDRASRLAGLEAGADDFITKPFHRAELRARTRTITRLNRYRRLHEAQVAVQANEARYRNLFNTIDEGFCVIEILLDAGGRPEDYRFLEVNPSFARQSGLAGAEGRTVRELVPTIEARWIESFGAVALTGAPVRFIDRADGLNRWFDIHAFRFGGAEDRRVAVLFSDTTARMMAEQTLRASETRFRALSDSAPLGIFESDAAGWATYFNPALLALMGQPVANTLGHGWKACIHSDDRFALIAGWKLNVRQGRPSDREMRLCWPDGSVHWVHFLAAPSRDAAGRITGFVGTVEDITARKAAELALRESEQWLKAFFEQAAVGVVQSDVKTGRFLRANQRFCDIVGYTRDEITRLAFTDITHPQDLETNLENVTRMRAGSIREFVQEKRYVRKDGAAVLAEIAVSSIGPAGAPPVSFVAFVQDVTERRLAREQMLRAQRLDNLGLLAAGIAHDFNNALAPIAMAGPLLRQQLGGGLSHRTGDEPGDEFHALRKPEISAATERLLAIVEKCADRGAGLVRQLLTFARGANGERQLLQARHLLRELGDLAEVTFPKSIRVKFVLPGELWPIHANATQIHQVLLNLCVNARDAMPEGGDLTLTATDSTLDEAAAAAIPGARPGDFLAVEVRDTGTGIPPGVLTRIWEPFFTTKGEGKGTGLGLSTVRGIVHQHDGFATVQTRVGQGTVFTVYLPAAPNASRGPGGAAAAPPARGRDELILVVDDEEGVRLLAAEILNGYGYRTVTACDGADAIAVFAPRAAEVRLVLTDLQMPLLGGAALALALRRLRPDLRIIAMSGTESRNSHARHREFASAYIAKPFQAPMLLLLVRATLDAPAPPAPARPPA